MKKILTQGVALDKLARRINDRSKKSMYQEGNPDEKVWINFQSTKKQKRSFSDVCKSKNINASAFLRTCVELLIQSGGNINLTAKALKNQFEDEEVEKV